MNVLFDETEPILDLEFTAFLLNIVSQAESVGILRIDVEDFLNLLQRKQKLAFFSSRSRAFQ